MNAGPAHWILSLKTRTNTMAKQIMVKRTGSLLFRLIDFKIQNLDLEITLCSGKPGSPFIARSKQVNYFAKGELKNFAMLPCCQSIRSCSPDKGCIPDNFEWVTFLAMECPALFCKSLGVRSSPPSSLKISALSNFESDSVRM